MMRCSALLIAAGLFLAMPDPIPAAQAQDMPATTAAIIDYQRLMREAKSANTIREQIEVRRQSLQADIAVKEQSLRDSEAELSKQKTILSADAYRQKRQELEAEVAEIQREVQLWRRELDEVSAQALNEVRNAIIEVTGLMAEERGFNLVLPSSSVLLFAPELDLTDAILVELDEKLPSVTVPFK